MIRRHNETRLKEDIHHLLNEWKTDVHGAHIIFLAAPGNNRYLFIKDTYLDKADIRLRNIPIVTRRPTLVEIKRVHQLLSTAEVTKFSAEEFEAERKKRNELETLAKLQRQVADAAVAEEERKRNARREDAVEEEEEEQAEDVLIAAVKRKDLDAVKMLYERGHVVVVPKNALRLTTPLFEACRIAGNAPIVSYLLSKKADPNVAVPVDVFRTALHAAAQCGDEEIIRLLLEHGADPTIRGRDARSAYSLAATHGTVRKLMGQFAVQNPSRWDWQRGDVPVAVVDEQAEAEKRRKKRQQKRERDRTKKQAEELEKKEMEQKKKAEEERLKVEKELLTVAAARKTKEANLSDREKRALAAEARSLPQPQQCAFCQQPLPLVPFERYQFKYCTTKCVQAHRVVIGK